MATAGILLTGGASRRMGTDKALVVVGGATLASRSAATLAAVCEPCVEVGPGHSPLPSVREVPPGSGPLSAAVAGWWALRHEERHDGPVIVLAVDMPRVTPELLGLLAAAGDPAQSVVPEAGGRLQPLCARYAGDAMERAAELVVAGERSMAALLQAVAFRRLAESDWAEAAPRDAFADVDTPADLEAL